MVVVAEHHVERLVAHQRGEGVEGSGVEHVAGVQHRVGRPDLVDGRGGEPFDATAQVGVAQHRHPQLHVARHAGDRRTIRVGAAVGPTTLRCPPALA